MTADHAGSVSLSCSVFTGFQAMRFLELEDCEGIR